MAGEPDSKFEPTKAMKVTMWLSIVILLSLIVNSLGHADSHRTNFRYLNWKYGRAPQDYKWCLHLFFADASLQNSLKGKSPEELRSWLPETGHAKEGSWQKEWLDAMPPKPHESFLVIGNTNVAIRLMDGKFDYILPMKG